MKILTLLIVVLLNVAISSAADHQAKETTTIPSFIMRLTTRRKRSLLLPDHGSVKLTIGLGKALIASSPKGLGISWEISNYYSGPTTVKEWLNEAPHQPARKSSELSNITNSDVVQYFEKNTIKYHNLLNPYYTHLDAVSIANSFPSMTFEGKDQIIHMGLKTKQVNTRRYSDPFHAVSKRSSTKSVGQNKHKGPLEEILTLLLGTDVKCGILRSICRSKQFLLPPGYSMIQDLVRIMFLMPTSSSGKEDLNLCDNKSYCDFKNENGGSFNFLDWILNPVKII